MARPKRLTIVEKIPDVTYFKPRGVRLQDLNEIVVFVSEFEALRLKDYENLGQIEASEVMEISQPTFNRLYADARRKIGLALVEGLAIKIEGGNYKMPNKDKTGPQGRGPKTGRGLGNCKPNDTEKLGDEKRELGPGKRLGRNQRLGKGQGLRRNNSE